MAFFFILIYKYYTFSGSGGDKSTGSLRLNSCLKSSSIIYKAGISNKVITVANKIPNAKDIAIGITAWACKLRSKTIGIRPIKVVNEVNIIALKRSLPDFNTESINERPSALALLTKSTIMRESFTTTPARAIMPQIDNTLTAWPSIR